MSRGSLCLSSEALVLLMCGTSRSTPRTVPCTLLPGPTTAIRYANGSRRCLSDRLLNDERERETHTHTYTHRDRDKERQTDRKGREKERQRCRERERDEMEVENANVIEIVNIYFH